MRLVNYTYIPTALVREIIRFVRPHGIGGFAVVIDDWKPGGRWVGVAHYTSLNYHPITIENPTIAVRIPSRIWRRSWTQGTRKDGEHPHPADRVEALVFLLAHEVRHLWQGKHPKVIDEEDKSALERDADAYAYGRLEDWRRSWHGLEYPRRS